MAPWTSVVSLGASDGIDIGDNMVTLRSSRELKATIVRWSEANYHNEGCKEKAALGLKISPFKQISYPVILKTSGIGCISADKSFSRVGQY